MGTVKLGRNFLVYAFFNRQLWKYTTLKINSLEREFYVHFSLNVYNRNSNSANFHALWNTLYYKL